MGGDKSFSVSFSFCHSNSSIHPALLINTYIQKTLIYFQARHHGLEDSTISRSCINQPDELRLLQTLVFKGSFYLSLMALFGLLFSLIIFFVTASSQRGALAIISQDLGVSRQRPIILPSISSLFHVRMHRRGEPTTISRANWHRLNSEINQRGPEQSTIHTASVYFLARLTVTGSTWGPMCKSFGQLHQRSHVPFLSERHYVSA